MECASCGQLFSSRNRLFKHLKELGHERQTSAANNAGGKSKYEKTAKGSQAYFEYYLRQKIINIEHDDAKNEKLWKEVYENLCTPLPITYRIQESSWIGNDFSSKLLTLVARDKIHNWTINGDDGEPLLRMYMTNDRHQFNKSRNDKGNRDKQLSSLLHALQELGATHRQELVSAIPALALWSCDSEKKEPVIIADLCAAPGSKSLQLLDLLHNMHDDRDARCIPNGLLVVNDSDRFRIVTLCQRSRRVPRSPMLAISTDGRYFPGIRRQSGYKQKYDKVLVDTPCSGDGTTRKNKQVWLEWSIPQAMSLHKLQRRLLRRALELCRPGATLVYSTCSLNVLENEAVISSVIEDIGGVEKVRIVALPSCLTDTFIAMKGLNTWLVPTSKYGTGVGGSFDMYESFEDVPSNLKSGKITPSMFPSSDQDLKNQLENCARFVPIKDNIDSGGFFIACLRRLHVGELCEKTKTEKQKSNNVAKSDVYEPPENTNGEGQREGDWFCDKCNALNFGRRSSRSCIGCKSRKPKTVIKDRQFQPLLQSPCRESELEPFLDYFGISSSNIVFQNVRVIYRRNERTFVLVSPHVAMLNISSQWGSFREAGISLFAMPTKPTGKEDIYNRNHNDNVVLFDEAVPLLALYATKRQTKIKPVLFRRALAEALSEDLKKETAETERIRSTLDIPLGTLCGHTTWYESHDIERAPGVFIVSCICPLEGSVGRLSFWCRRYADGSTSIETSSRVLAAMLVIVHSYLEVSPLTE